jgi:hypothetical protein
LVCVAFQDERQHSRSDRLRGNNLFFDYFMPILNENLCQIHYRENGIYEIRLLKLFGDELPFPFEISAIREKDVNAERSNRLFKSFQWAMGNIPLLRSIIYLRETLA